MFARLGLCTVGLLLSGLFCSEAARADYGHDRHDDPTRLMLALDLDYATAISADGIERGGGGGVRLGSELDVFLVTLIPELNFDYHTFSGYGDATTVTGKLGGRIRFLKILEPGIFAHAGVGHVGGFDPFTGFAFDAGLTLDLTILPLIDLGLHLAWNRVFGNRDHDGLSYGTFGAQVALVL